MTTTPPAELVSRRSAVRQRLGATNTWARKRAVSGARAVADAGSARYLRSIDRMLLSPGRVTSAAEGQKALAAPSNAEAVTDRVQRAVMVAVPIVRRAAKGARFFKVPWVMVGSTAFSSTATMVTGARELQVLSSLVAHRIEQSTGQPADPLLVKKLAIDLYLHPKQSPGLEDRRLRLGGLLRRWGLRGALGRKTGKSAKKALVAAERLDVDPLIARWAELDASAGPLEPGRSAAHEPPPGA